jgi:hypothetical protein
MAKEKSIVEEAIIQMKNLEEAVAENAKGILASTMKEEIKELVKESLSEQEDEIDMTDVDMEEPEMGMEDPEMGMEEPAPEENFKESVEDVLSKYFVVTDEEKKLHEEKNKKNFIKNKLVNIEVKNEIERMSESVKQMNTAKRFLNENVNAKFIGKTNKQNLVFSVNGKNIKVNTTGNII